MDALIATFVEDYKQRVAMYNDDSEGNLFNDVASAESDGELAQRVISSVQARHAHVDVMSQQIVWCR